MLIRGLRLLLAALLLVTVVSVVQRDAPAPGEVQPVALRPVAARAASCSGLERRDVRGADPEYTRKRLAEYRNHRRACRGVWLPRPRRYLVPQGLAVSGGTAWVSGFRYRPGYGQRPCQLTRVDLTTGERLQFHSAIYGRVGQRPRTYCRHGGGILQRGKQLWVAEKNKLWLVDPRPERSVLEARRVWRIAAPARGSAVVATDTHLGLVPYQKRGKPRIYWFAIDKLLKRGVLDLAPRGSGRSTLGASTSTRVPRYVQGATMSPTGRLYLARSNLACGELVTPSGKRVGFVPGAEGLQFSNDGRRLWAVSESGARPYSVSRVPLTPGVVAFEWPQLSRGKTAACGFPAY